MGIKKGMSLVETDYRMKQMDFQMIAFIGDRKESFNIEYRLIKDGMTIKSFKVFFYKEKVIMISILKG